MLISKTARKRAFYLIFASLVRKCDIKDVIENWDDNDIYTYPKESFLITDYFAAEIDSLNSQIIEHVKNASINGIPFTDLAIIYVHLITIKLGAPQDTIIKDVASFADEFGSTDSSADFCYAILSNICK